MNERENRRDLLFLILTGMVLLLKPFSSMAQQLPSLPVSPQITVGTLDNGIHYYLVNNAVAKGTVSMALVQRTGKDDETDLIEGQSVVYSRGALSELPRFSATTPFEFMNRKALFPSNDGYVSVKENATIYRFDDVVSSSNQEALDSTLLMMFDIISWTTSLSDRYSTSSQAIIISGVVDQNALLNKMNMLALLVPRKGGQKENEEYVWKNREKKAFYLMSAVKKGHASVELQYSSPRISWDDMNTVQSLTSGKLANEMNILIQNRLRYEMSKAKVPCSVVKSTYVSSALTGGGEKIGILISTEDEYMAQAMEILGMVLGNLDAHGTDVDEYHDVQNEFKIGLREVYDDVVRLNSNYVDCCIASFLYNAPLSSSQYNYDFFYKRVLDPKVELSLFNNYMKSILHPDRNLRIICATNLENEKGLALEKIFEDAWKKGSAQKAFRVSFNENANDLKKTYFKAKIKAESAEPMTGGKMWTFSNGMRVIYKNSGREGHFHYEMLVKTGFSQAVNMKNVEKPYLSDVIGMNYISGMTGDAFQKMLHANGIQMETEVSISDMTIKGTAPDNELPLVLKSLLAIGYDRSPDYRSLEYYNRCSNLALDQFEDTEIGRMAVLDSMLSPSMNCSSYKRPLKLSSDFLDRANRFFDTVFSKTGDGVLILVGKFDEETLKKTLCRYIGGFKSSNSSAAYRARKQEAGISGRVIQFGTGKAPSLDLMFETPINYTAENYMTIKVAAMAMRDAISKEAATMGWSVSVVGNFIMFPEEKFRFSVQMKPSDSAGLPASMVQEENVEKVLVRINGAIDEIAQKGMDLNLFPMYQILLGNMLDEDMTETGHIQDFLIMRYSYGKDLMTKYKEKIKAVSVDKVNSFLSDMAAGAVAEYGVKVKDSSKVEVQEVYVPKPFLPKSAPFRQPSDTLGINQLYRSLFQN